ncbi:MAG: hypothetical protein HYY78_02695 [Betaproteobacteria bacterium]|nr:hypothetical protein [Betaproteobacteria bacterium]
MASPNTHARNASRANFALQRLLRPGRVAMIVGWLALWLGATGYAYCAAPLAPAGPGGNAEHAASFDHGRAPQHFRSSGDNPDCRQLVNAATVSQPPAATPASGDDTGDAAFSFPAQPLASPAGGRLPGHHWYVRPRDRPLYLSTSRLLI